MLVLPERAGPADPMGSSPGRRIGSARRTTSIDTSRPNGPQENSVVDARARDLVTGPAGDATYQRDQNIRAQIAPNRELIAVESDPPQPRLPAGRSFTHSSTTYPVPPWYPATPSCAAERSPARPTSRQHVRTSDMYM